MRAPDFLIDAGTKYGDEKEPRIGTRLASLLAAGVLVIGSAGCAAAGTATQPSAGDTAHTSSVAPATTGGQAATSPLGPKTVEFLKTSGANGVVVRILMPQYSAKGVDKKRLAKDGLKLNKMVPIDTPEKVQQFYDLLIDGIKSGHVYNSLDSNDKPILPELTSAQKQRIIDQVPGYVEKELGGEFQFNK